MISITLNKGNVPALLPVEWYVPSSQSTKPQSGARPWYVDAVCALAFTILALMLGKSLSRALGPVIGLFCFTICAGFGWYFARAAKRGFLARK